MISRRAMIVSGASALAVGGAHLHTAHAAEKSFLSQGLPDGVYDTATLDALPGKRPLIKLSYRPPNYETPLSLFTSELTPNESFFVRYHLAGVPDAIDAARWKLKVGGEGAGTPLELAWRTSGRTLKPWRLRPCANAPATAVVFPRRMCPASNGASAL